ncbi:hypothetical protein, partial [Porphyromonas crevioricanis]
LLEKNSSIENKKNKRKTDSIIPQFQEKIPEKENEIIIFLGKLYRYKRDARRNNQQKEKREIVPYDDRIQHPPSRPIICTFAE